MIDNAYGAGTPYGTQFITLGFYGGGGGGYIEQAIGGLTIGDVYSVGFALASELGDGQSRIEVMMSSGSSTPAGDFTAPVTPDAYWRTWDSFSYDFLANATSATLRFTQILGTGGVDGGLGYDVGLDNVTISQQGTSNVPEPGTLVLLGLPLAYLGLRRRLSK